MNADKFLIKQIRVLLLVFIIGLVFSGATAIPLETELRISTSFWKNCDPNFHSNISIWLNKVQEALITTNAQYPFIAYGTDWLAFAHFVIAVAFIGPLHNPVKNVWVIEFGMIACALVVPFALIMGGIRGIPFGWRLIDCSFGVFGIIPLWFCRRLINKLEKVSTR